MPLKRLTWSKTRGTARECQPAARGCRPALHLAAAAAAAAALPCPALPTLAGQTPPHAQQQPGFTSASRRGRRGSRSPGPPSKAGGSQGRREGGRVPTRTCVSSSRLLPLPSGSSPAASAAPSAPPNSAALAEASLAARVAYIRAPRSPHPLARATSCRRTPPPSGARAPAAAGLGRGTFVPGPAAAGSRSPEGAFSPRLRRLQGTRWSRCDGESQPAADPEALPDLADCKQ